MQTECNQETFGFTAHFSRRLEAGFSGGRVSTDGGALLLQAVERRVNLMGRLGECFTDGCARSLVKLPLPQMLAQRIYGLVLGYEDLNDHEQLRSDPLLALLSGRRDLEKPLAGKSTLNRLELVAAPVLIARSATRPKSGPLIGGLVFGVAQQRAGTDCAGSERDRHPYGHQPERSFHGYYDSYCYLPLYIFAGDQLLCSRLRSVNKDAAAGSVEEVSHIVRQVRQRWLRTRIVLCADFGFCREELMGWCEANTVDYLFGLLRNQRLGNIIGAKMQQARVLHQSTGKAPRVFPGFAYRTCNRWSPARRVVAKAEYLDKGENRASSSLR